MQFDQLILLGVLDVGIVIGLFTLHEAKKYRAKRNLLKSDVKSSHITQPGCIFEDLGFSPKEVEELKKESQLIIAAAKRSFDNYGQEPKSVHHLATGELYQQLIY